MMPVPSGPNSVPTRPGTPANVKACPRRVNSQCSTGKHGRPHGRMPCAAPSAP